MTRPIIPTPFAAASMPEPNSGCWLWVGAAADAHGYGAWRGARAHRVAWERSYGPIPAGAYVCHRCDVRACVNPGHLFLGSPGDNVRDMVKKGRQRAPTRRPAPRRWAAIRNLALALGVQTDTVDKWRARGSVPHRWRFPILAEAGKRGVLLTFDEMEWPVAPEPAPPPRARARTREQGRAA